MARRTSASASWESVVTPGVSFEVWTGALIEGGVGPSSLTCESIVLSSKRGVEDILLVSSRSLVLGEGLEEMLKGCEEERSEVKD